MRVPVITVADVEPRMASGAWLVDVRNPDEYEWAHVDGSALVPLHELVDRLGEFPTDREVLVICKSGGRSAMAAEFLREQGVDAVNVAGGMLAWIDGGHPVATGGPA